MDPQFSAGPTDPDDWRRRGQEQGLPPGTVFRRRPYRALDERWEHDHCEMCHIRVLANELRVPGQYRGAVRVFVDGRQVASIPRGLQGEYREVVESLNREGVAATIHVELESDAYVDVWGLCKPERRPEGEPLLPTQYREDIDLLDGIASALDESLASRAKEKKVRRKGAHRPAIRQEPTRTAQIAMRRSARM